MGESVCAQISVEISRETSKKWTRCESYSPLEVPTLRLSLVGQGKTTSRPATRRREESLAAKSEGVMKEQKDGWAPLSKLVSFHLHHHLLLPGRHRPSF